MSTEAQIAANQANAQLSTGPQIRFQVTSEIWSVFSYWS